MTEKQKERVWDAMEKNKTGGWISGPDGVIEIFEDVSKAIEERIDRRIESKINKFADEIDSFAREDPRNELGQDIEVRLSSIYQAKFPAPSEQDTDFESQHTIKNVVVDGRKVPDSPDKEEKCKCTIGGAGMNIWMDRTECSIHTKMPLHKENENDEPKKYGHQSISPTWAEWTEKQLKLKNNEIDRLIEVKEPERLIPKGRSIEWAESQLKERDYTIDQLKKEIAVLKF